MGPRAALTPIAREPDGDARSTRPLFSCALAVWLALAGCAASRSMPGMPPDLSVGPGTDMGAGCPLVRVTADQPSAPARLTATAEASGAGTPTWTVERVGDGQIYVPAPLDATNLRVQFTAELPGTWIFYARFPGCSSQQSITLTNANGVHASYRLRALPPESTMLPLKDTLFVLTGGTPQQENLILDSGTRLSSVLTAPGGPVAGEVRLIADVGPDAVTTAGADGRFALALSDASRYQALLIPRAQALAPHLGAPGQTVAALLAASFSVGAGATVTGAISDGVNGLGGARVVLRAGALPSSLATSASDGTFALHAEAGSYQLTFGSDGWPEATVAGVSVPAAGAAIAIRYGVARVAVGGRVVASDGATPVANARVGIASRPLGVVASVTAGGNTLPAAGRVARVVVSDGNGNLPALLLPSGTYDLVVEPPPSSPDGLTAMTTVVAGAASWTLRLAPKITLTGRVTGDAGQAVAGARVTAFELAGLGAAPATTTDASGSFALTVDAGAAIDLLVEPGASDHLAGARVRLAAGTGVRDVALGPGLLVTGLVLAPSSTPLADVLIEALCDGCGAAAPVATAISDATGTYRLYLPDPGSAIVDGGASD